MKTTRNCTRPSVLGAILLSLFAAPASAQLLVDGAYGLTPEQAENGQLPAGWISLLGPDEQAKAPLSIPLQGCSTMENEESLNYVPWPGGVVPYEFNTNVSGLNQSRVLAAFAILEPLANVDFVPRAGEPDFLHIRADSINQSTSIGYQAGQTTIRISSWTTQGTVIHEFLHALGFYHEQSRPDRTSFVDVFAGNIQMGSEGNFSVALGSLRAGPYDFSSLMHYPPCAFSTNCAPNSNCLCSAGTETILPKPAYSSFLSQMGQRTAITTLDIHGLRALYPFGHWRFVEADHIFVGNGTGANPWKELSAARTGAPSGARVFIMPGTYDTAGVWSTPMVLDAPVGGVVME